MRQCPPSRPLAQAPLLFSKHRLEALTDGIFAVAMTLLVIELEVPERAGGSTAPLVSELWA